MHGNGRAALRYTKSLCNAISIFKSGWTRHTHTLHFDRNCQCNCKWLLTKRLRSPLLCVQTSRDLCIFGCIYISVRVFWHVIYEWTIELTVIDAHDEWKHKNCAEERPNANEIQKKIPKTCIKTCISLDNFIFLIALPEWQSSFTEMINISQLSFATIWMRQNWKMSVGLWSLEKNCFFLRFQLKTSHQFILWILIS